MIWSPLKSKEDFIFPPQSDSVTVNTGLRGWIIQSEISATKHAVSHGMHRDAHKYRESPKFNTQAGSSSWASVSLSGFFKPLFVAGSGVCTCSHRRGGLGFVPPGCKWVTNRGVCSHLVVLGLAEARGSHRVALVQIAYSVSWICLFCLFLFWGICWPGNKCNTGCNLFL